jgi:hypothetical protein
MSQRKNRSQNAKLKESPIYSPEEEELLDSGLRMLASMIAETHMKRIATEPGYRDKMRRRSNPDVV